MKQSGGILTFIVFILIVANLLMYPFGAHSNFGYIITGLISVVYLIFLLFPRLLGKTYLNILIFALLVIGNPVSIFIWGDGYPSFIHPVSAYILYLLSLSTSQK